MLVRKSSIVSEERSNAQLIYIHFFLSTSFKLKLPYITLLVSMIYIYNAMWQSIA